MPRCFARGRVGLGLKAAVALTEVVQIGDDGQTVFLSSIRDAEPREVAEIQQGTQDERDVEAMIG